MENDDILLISSIKRITEREIFLLMENFDSFKEIRNCDADEVSKRLGIRKIFYRILRMKGLMKSY